MTDIETSPTVVTTTDGVDIDADVVAADQDVDVVDVADSAVPAEDETAH